MQNRKVGPFNVEVWSNPDVGTGSFYIIVDPPKGSALTVPADMKVQVAVQPVSKRLPVAIYNAWREKLLDHVEFKTVVPSTRKKRGTSKSRSQARRPMARPTPMSRLLRRCLAAGIC